MSLAGSIQGDFDVNGRFRCKEIVLPQDCSGDSQANPVDPLLTDKTWHRHNKGHRQPNTAATAVTETVHDCFKDGTVVGFAAGSIAKATGDSTVTIDLRKNGTSILTTPITLNSSSANYTPQTAIIASPTVLADDALTIVQTISAGTGTLPTGVYSRLVVDEKPA